MIIVGFLGLILTGTLLLMLPISSAGGQSTDFITALFTSTTSSCVTGLVVVPTYSYWSLFGKIVILFLIQLGGFGVICTFMGILILIRKNISLRGRKVIQESYNLDSAKGVVGNIKSIIAGTAFIEVLGALLYSTRFIPKYGFVKGIWYSVFHSISAFCNAGIDVIGSDGFMPFQQDIVIVVTTMILIIFGGIGFVVWWEIINIVKRKVNNKIPLRKGIERLSLHSKVVLFTTAVLIFGGTIIFFTFEYTNKGTIGELSIGHKILSSAFQSVTCRTAGFSTIDQGMLRDSSILISCILMLIGGSPMGTAGGIKTSTIALLLMEVKSVVRGEAETVAFNRRINRNNIKTALAVIITALSILLMAILGLSFTEKIPLGKLIFEAFSAIGTVGLTTGITSSLTTIGKIIIIVLMFFGRVGPITIVMALAKKRRSAQHSINMPEKSIMIG